MTSTTEGNRLRDEAARHDREAAESFERCDTDGFLSQWASGISARVARANADIADDGGLGLFERTVLERLDGTAVDARVVNTRYGTKYRVDATDEWLPYRPARASTLARRGYRERTVKEVGPAKAIAWAPPGARGLSGADQVRVIVIRTDRPKAEGWTYRGAPPTEVPATQDTGGGGLLAMATEIAGRVGTFPPTEAKTTTKRCSRSTYDGGPGRVHVDDKLDEYDGVPYSIPKYADADTPGLIDSREARAEARRVIEAAFAAEACEVGSEAVLEGHRIALAVFDRMAEAAETVGRM